MNGDKVRFCRDNQSVSLHPHGEDTGGSAISNQPLACLSPSLPPFSQSPLGSSELYAYRCVSLQNKQARAEGGSGEDREAGHPPVSARDPPDLYLRMAIRQERA